MYNGGRARGPVPESHQQLTPHDQIHHGVGEGGEPPLPGHTPNTGKERKDQHQCIQEDHAHGPLPTVLLTSSRVCKKGDGLWPIPSGQDRSSRGKHTEGITPPENGPENQQAKQSM